MIVTRRSLCHVNINNVVMIALLFHMGVDMTGFVGVVLGYDGEAVEEEVERWEDTNMRTDGVCVQMRVRDKESYVKDIILRSI